MLLEVGEDLVALPIGVEADEEVAIELIGGAMTDAVGLLLLESTP